MKSIKLLLIALLLAVAGGDAFAQKIEQVTGIPKNETKAEKKAREKKLKALADSIAFIDAQKGVIEIKNKCSNSRQNDAWQFRQNV